VTLGQLREFFEKEAEKLEPYCAQPPGNLDAMMVIDFNKALDEMEPELREHVDAACRMFVERREWPTGDPQVCALVAVRLHMACRRLKRLRSRRTLSQEIDQPSAIRSFLIDWWSEGGLSDLEGYPHEIPRSPS
jgi:hypothetical protein